MKALLLVVLLGAAPALGLPVDRQLSLAPGELHAEWVRYLVSAAVVPADLATAEILPAGELLITPLRDGDGAVDLFEEGQLEVVRLHVGRGPPSPGGAFDALAARSSCPGLELGEIEGETLLRAMVSTAVCRAALLAGLPSSDLFAGQLRLEQTPEVLQVQLREAEAALAAAHLGGLSLSYVGATLTLQGRADASTRRRALQVLWNHVLGRLGFDDQTQETPDVR